VCLYRSYGGGGVQKTVVNASGFGIGFQSLEGYPFPEVNFGFPINAHLAHYAKLRRDGSLTIPDSRYETYIFGRFRAAGFVYYSAAEEADAILVPYWR
jgi:hypothetical protein